MTLQSILSLIREGAVATAAMVGAFVAWRGLRAWQEQLRGKVEYELARRVLKGVLTLRDAVQSIREPFIAVAEFVEAYKAEGKELQGIPDEQGQALVYKQRWEPLRKAWNELHLDLLEAETIWGADVRQLEVRLNEHLRELDSAVRSHLWRLLQASQGIRPQPRSADGDTSPVLYRRKSEDDSYFQRLLEVIQAFEQFFRPKLTF